MNSCLLVVHIYALEHCIKDIVGQFSTIQYKECYDLPIKVPHLGYPIPNVSSVDDFEFLLPQRSNKRVDTPFTDLIEGNDILETLHVFLY